MSRFVSRPARYALAAVALFAGATCADNSITGPGGSGLRTVLGFAPAFTKAAADIFRGLVAFQLEVDNVHLVLKYPDGTTAKDTVISLGAGQDSIAIEAEVALEAPEAMLDATIELRDGAQVLFTGSQQVRARRGGAPSAAPAIPIVYAGPGASATNLDLAPLDTTILSTDSIALRPSATDAKGQPVTNLVIEYTVKDGAQGTVSIAGVFKPSLLRGKTYVIARLPNGVRDSASINFIPLPSQLALISGNAQSGVVGRALAQPIVVEARGSDNLPVPGATVHFTVTAGGGIVAPTTVQVDANGRASATLTLGNLVGSNTVQASIGVAAPVVITATSTPTGPGALEIVTTTASARAGVPLVQQPVVQLRDSLTNLITTSGLQIQASLVGEGRILAGTTVATTDNTGKATFTNLQVNGLVGASQLRFTLANTTVQVLSTSIAVTAGHARALVLDPQPSGSALSGVALAAQPQVHLRDAFGNAVSAAGVPVTASLIVAGEGRTLGGNLTVSTSPAGAAQFTNLLIAGTAGTTRLVFAAHDSIASVTSNEVTVSSGQAAALLAVTSLVYADSAGANVPAAALPSVSLRDASNNPVPGVEVKFRRHGGAGSSINGQPDTLVVATTDANGNAALTSRRLQTLVGLDTVLVTAAGLNDTLRFVAAVTNGNAASLVFAQQPSNTQGGSLISPPVVVLLYDQFGNNAVNGASSTSSVTLALNPGGSTAILSGTTTVAATGGVATFADLSVNLAGSNYTLAASTASIPAVTSTAFDVSVGAGSVLSIVSGDAQGALAGDMLSQPLVVRVTDLGGNPVQGASVVFTIVSGGGMFGDQSDTTTVPSNQSGLASVTWQVGTGAQQVAANVGGTPISFRAHVASTLAIVTEPTLTPASGAVLATQPVVRLLDEAGNIVRRGGVQIGTELIRVPMVDAFMDLTGARVANTNADGVATFTDLVLTGQTIQPVQIRFFRELNEAADPGIGQVNTSTITVQAGAAALIESSEFDVHHVVNTAGVRNVGVHVSDIGGWNDIAGAPITFQIQSGACTLANAQSTTDANGVATVDINIASMASSCVVEGRTSSIGGEGAQVLHRLYLAPSGMAVWTGALDGASWNDSRNWLGGLPSPSADVFIPQAAAFGAFPNPSGRTSLNSMIIETGALFNITRDTLVLNDSLIADGIVNGADATVHMLGLGSSPTVRGNVQAKLIVGRFIDPVTCDGQYHPRGGLIVDSLQVDCNFYQLANETVTVRGAARVAAPGVWDLRTGSVTVGGDLSIETPSGYLGAELHIGTATVVVNRKLVVTPESAFGQNGGTISVSDSTIFSGDQALRDGLLNVGGAFRLTANGDNYRLDGQLPHVTRFVGPGGDSRRLQWDSPAGGLPSQFGQLEFAMTGSPGIVFFTSLSDATVRAGHTIVRRDAHVFIPGGQGPRYGLTTGSANRSGATGLIVEPGGQITNNGSITVVNNTLCLLTGVITGNFSCFTP